MRLFCLEVKRIMKSRRTIILLTAALLLAVIMAYLPISFESINRPGDNGSVRQLENRKKILENKQRNEERRVRTRRLIERGAILEGIFPLAPNLSGAEVKAFLIALSYLPGAAELTANLPKSGDTP